MNPHLFISIIPLEAAHRRLPCRPPQLGGGVAATKPAGDQEGRAEEEEEGGQEEGRKEEAGSGERRRGQACSTPRKRYSRGGATWIGSSEDSLVQGLT